MLKSIFTSAIRNLFRNRSFSLINLIGLSVSMSFGLLIILVIKSQNSFDTYHRDAERIYRINTEAIRTDGDTEPYASVPLAVAAALNDEYAYAEKLVRLDRQFSGDVTIENTVVHIGGLFADPSFLEVFNFPLQKGDVGSALQKSNSIVLTNIASQKLFGTRNPMGEVVTMSGYGEFTVTGVLEPFQGPTHFEFEALASSSSIPVLEKQKTIINTTLNWNNYYTGYAYLKLKEGVSPSDVENALKSISKKYYADVKYETRDMGYRFYLQPLTGITPGPMLSNNMGKGMPDLLLIMLSVLVGIIMIMACFNYTQLMIAKSLTRAKEIGLRKIVGANRWQVFMQFIGEAIIFALATLIFSYLLLQLIKPAFSQLHLTQEFIINLNEDYTVLLLFLLFAVGVGIVAGMLPAIYLSAFKPLKVLKNAGDVRVYARLTLRKMLMVAQFTVSLIFILLVITIYRQIDFMLESDYGFNQKNIINIRLGAMDYDRFSTEVRKLSGIARVGGVSHKLGTWEDGASDYKRNREDELFVMRDFSVDENYLQNLEVKFIAGKSFEPTAKNQIIINEAALPNFNFDTPLDAVGQNIYMGDSTELRIAGVVKNFNFRPLSYAIGPVGFRYDRAGINILSARLSSTDQKLMAAQMEAIWKKLDSRPFEWMTMESEIDGAYEEAGFFDVLKIVGYITVVAISLACLGILGMAMYLAQTRIKEIGIRKVMGATLPDILLLLSRSFMMLIGIAVLIGVPISYLLSNLFLDLYAYKVPLTPWLVFAGVLFLVILALMTISTQTIRAAFANPVKSLRYE